MDPLGIAAPDVTGYIPLADNVRLHYELYTPDTAAPTSSGTSDTISSTRKSPLLMLMGAFATKAHFAEMARFIADSSGHEVCIYDHRGVNRSGPPRLEPQTAAALAADALVVADTLWGPEKPLHVYGASMGGMVAQELALLLIPQQRLLSLSLSITCRGMRPMHGLLNPIFTPQVLKRFFELWFWDSKPNLVRRLMRLLLTRQLMESLHPCGETLGQVYQRVWLERFDELWTFNDHAAGANHAHVVLHQYLTDQQAAILRDSGVPIACQVSTQDNLIPAAMQFELADMLKARTITIPTGHLGFLPWRDRYYSLLLEQLAMGEAVKGVQAAQRARVSRSGLAAGQEAAPGSLSLMEALSKIVASSTSSGSNGGCSIGGSSSGSGTSFATAECVFGCQAPFQDSASPEPSLGSEEGLGECGGQEEAVVGAGEGVPDMSIELDDSFESTELGWKLVPSPAAAAPESCIGAAVATGAVQQQL